MDKSIVPEKWQILLAFVLSNVFFMQHQNVYVLFVYATTKEFQKSYMERFMCKLMLGSCNWSLMH